MTDWTITVVDSLRIKGRPANWFPPAEKLIACGVPLRIARRWKRERYLITTGLKRRIKQDRN